MTIVSETMPPLLFDGSEVFLLREEEEKRRLREQLETPGQLTDPKDYGVVCSYAWDNDRLLALKRQHVGFPRLFGEFWFLSW